MATEADIQDVADACIVVANALKKNRADMDQTLQNNTAHGIDWNSQAAEDALVDKPYTKEQIANLIAAFAAINLNIWDTFHGTNIEVVTSPIV